MFKKTSKNIFLTFFVFALILTLTLSSLVGFQSFISGDVKFKIASYNVKNLFDDKLDGSEYTQFIPNKYHNTKHYKKKLAITKKIIKNINADIIGLQEVENLNVLNDLAKNTQYKYKVISKKRNSAIALGVLSKFKILEQKDIQVHRAFRNILRVKIKIPTKTKDTFLYVYVNHWSSKKSKESHRVYYAKALMDDIRSLDDEADYILLGDFNSNYNEFISFKYDKKLNDTHTITGINQILNTAFSQNLVKKQDIINTKFSKKNLLHYNLWLDVRKKDRFSYIYRGDKITPDSIILSSNLFDDKKISYIDKSFSVFKNKLTYNNNQIIKKHSDHLPIYAFFSTAKQNYQTKSYMSNNADKKHKQDIIIKAFNKKNTLDKIEYLYKTNNINKNVELKNMIVVYKSKNKTILKTLKYAKHKTTKHKSILIYTKDTIIDKLKLGHIYDITVTQIETFYGTKSIKKFTLVKPSKNKHMPILIKKLYLKDKNELFKPHNQNEIVSGLKGVYKKGYLHFTNNNNNNNKKIKVYFAKPLNRPAQNSNILIKNAQLNVFKTKIQITINQLSDYKIL